MELRTKDSYQTYVYDFLKFDIFVSCPGCSKKAVVRSKESSLENREELDVKVICISCGYNKRLSEKPIGVLFSSNNKKIAGSYYVIGGAIDPYFHLPLWLKTNIEQNTLWAYNFEHLNFLKGHIEAKLRERSVQDLANKSLGSRLPKWMTSKKNRDQILRKISELQKQDGK